MIIPIGQQAKSTKNHSSLAKNNAGQSISLQLNCIPHRDEHKGSLLVNVAVVPPDNGTRRPIRFMCIIDTSYSMNEEASTKSEKNEKMGFSRLDLVKHSVATVIRTLQQQDELAIISFSTDSKVVLEITKMDRKGKKKANTCLAALEPDSSTNIWSGLKLAMDTHRELPPEKNTNTVMILLTDGVSNVDPPRGIVPTLVKYFEQHPKDFTIHTFGYGYSLDSKLLEEISVHGSGIFSFIPDASMVGTVFVNFLSNMLAMMTDSAKLSIVNTTTMEVKHTAALTQNNNNNNNNNKQQAISWLESGSTLNIDLGIIQFGQSRNTVIEMKYSNEKPLLVATLQYNDNGTQRTVSTELNAPMEVENPENESKVSDVYFQFARALMVREISKALSLAQRKRLTEAKEIINTLFHTIDSLPKNDLIEKLLLDIRSSEAHSGGQVEQAFSKDEWFTKWGEHYLPSLVRSHLMQQCNNFKDPGVQAYGGSLFRSIQTTADDIFCNIPPPKPSIQTSGNITPVTNMKSFYNRRGACFHGDNNVLMKNNCHKRVRDIRAGDVLLGKDATTTTRVTCVIEIPVQSAEMIQLECGLRITPWHPIRVDGLWKFPADIPSASKSSFDGNVYNFVLESGHIMVVEGTECVTLGHGFQDDVVQHDFFGTEKVIQNLQQLQGWNKGFISLSNLESVRDSHTGLVSQWKQRE